MTDTVTFDNNSRIRDAAAAKKFRYALGLIRNAARLLPVAPRVLHIPNIVPKLQVPDVYFILGYDDAVSALSDDSVFATPYGPAMQALDVAGSVSLLGFNQTQDAQYRSNLCQVMRAMPLDQVSQMGAVAATSMGGGLTPGVPVDLLGDILIPVTLDVTFAYFGVQVDAAFHEWAMAIINYVFGPPGPPLYKKLAAEAAGRLIDAFLKPKLAPQAGDNVLGRLQASVGADTALLRATIKALLVGSVPTLPQAGFNIMKVLLAQPQAMELARAAARHGDDDLLRRCLIEALRFRPVLPVIFRKCVAPPLVMPRTAGSGDLCRRFNIPTGADVGVVCLAANFDGRRVKNPYRFDPGRPASDNLSFGHGKHWCLGMPLALEVLVTVFRLLLEGGPVEAVKDAPATRYFLDYFAMNFTIMAGKRGA